MRVALRPVGLPGQRARATLPLIGRDIELALVRSSIEAVIARQRSQLILVLGEAGVGKNRLVDEIERLVERDQNAFVLSGRCVPYGEANVWFPIADAIRQRLELPSDADAEAARRRIGEVVAIHSVDVEAHEQARLLDAVMHLLGYDSALAGDDPNRALDETGRAVRLILESQAAFRPVILRLTDLHWADEVVLNMVEGLLRRLSRLPVIVIATARHTLADRWVLRPDRHNMMTLTLDALDDAAAAELLDAVLPATVDVEQRQVLLDRAGGNPLFLEELAALVRDGDGEFTSDLPSNLQGLVGARLDRLSDVERTLLDDAAVLGRDGSIGDLERMSLELRNAVSIETPMGSLVGHDLLELPTDTTWRFRSDLVRDVVYGRLTKAQRAQRHFGVAKYIEDAFGPTVDVATVAYHYRRAAELSGELGGVDFVADDVSATALRFTRKAASSSMNQGSHASALALLTEAIELGGPEHPDRAEMALDRAKANIEMRHLQDARRDIDDALALADPGQRPDLVAVATLRLGEVEQWSGEYELAASLIEGALAGFEELGDRREAEALRSLGQTLLLDSRVDEAEVVLQRALKTGIASEGRRGAAWAQQNLAWLSFIQGRATEAEERLAEAEAQFRELGDSAGREWSQGLLAFVRMHQGHFAEARHMATVGLEQARARDDKWAEAMMGVLLASTNLWTGRTNEAVPVARDALRMFTSIQDVGGTTQAVAVLGRAMLRAGQIDEGLRLLRGHAAEISDPTDDDLSNLASNASATAAVSIGDVRVAEILARTDVAGVGGSLIGDSERLVAVGIARLQAGDAAGSCDALQHALEVDAEVDNPNVLSALMLAQCAMGVPFAQLRDAGMRVTRSLRATYLDLSTANIALGLAAARDNDVGCMDDAFADVHTDVASTGDVLCKALAALAESQALAAVGSPRAVAASNEAESQLDRLGIAATGWRTAFELAAGARPTER